MKREDIYTLLIVAAALFIFYKVVKLFDFFAPPDSTTPGSQDAPPPGGIASYDRSYYEQAADQIEQNIWGGFDIWENDSAVGAILMQMNSDRDFWELSNAYGVRGEGIIIQKYYNLVQTLTEYLDDDVRELVNSDYSMKGMNTRV